ncbi:MAG TPA: hypothetical protein VF708_17970 [Pyrinomonadaceae bacterium]|jgi:hypothetical protein
MFRNSSSVHHLAAVESPEPTPAASSAAKPAGIHPAPPEVCSFCFGTGMEVVAGRGARRCRTQDQGQELLEVASIPRRYSECSLSNYHPEKGNGSQLLAFNYANRLVREYPAVDRGLLLKEPRARPLPLWRG